MIDVWLGINEQRSNPSSPTRLTTTPHPTHRLLEAVEELTTGPLFPLESSREWERSAEPRDRAADANYLLLLRALLQAMGEVKGEEGVVGRRVAHEPTT